jgi:hypothetical protein
MLLSRDRDHGRRRVGCVWDRAHARLRELLVYYLEPGIPFVWPGRPQRASLQSCILLATLIGAAGALFRWRASRREPYDLIRSEG